MSGHLDLLSRLMPAVAYDVQGSQVLADLRAEAQALEAALWSADGLLDESDPRTTYHLLSDWERVLGLPDTCTGALPILTLRRAAVLAKFTQRGGQSRAFFIALAARLGFVITITEPQPYNVMSPVVAPMFDGVWAGVWQVNAALSGRHPWPVVGGVNEPLDFWSNNLLECVIRRFKPAYTRVLFSYQ